MLEPWGDDWQQASTIAAEVANSERERPIPLDYYVPRQVRQVPEGPSEDQQVAVLDSFVRDSQRIHGQT